MLNDIEQPPCQHRPASRIRSKQKEARWAMDAGKYKRANYCRGNFITKRPLQTCGYPNLITYYELCDYNRNVHKTVEPICQHPNTELCPIYYHLSDNLAINLRFTQDDEPQEREGIVLLLASETSLICSRLEN